MPNSKCAKSRATLDETNKVPTINLGGTGADNTKYLRGDRTWQIPPGGDGTPGDTVVTEKSFGQSETAGTSLDYSRKDHTHGTMSNPVPAHAALTGSTHGVSASGFEDKGNKGIASGYAPLDAGIKVPTVNLGGAGADATKYLRGDQAWAVPSGGGAPPAWKGNIAGAWGDGDPQIILSRMLHNPINATPTNIGIAVARIAYFKLDTDLIVNKIRIFGVGATTNIYRVAIYRNSDSVRLTSELPFTTASQAWVNITVSPAVTLTAGVLYFVAISVNAVGTTAGCLCHSATTSRIGVLPTSWPGNLDIDMASPKISPFGFANFAVTNGALPATAPARSAQAAWTGGFPGVFLDNNNA